MFCEKPGSWAAARFLKLDKYFTHLGFWILQELGMMKP